jgi:hypothetical protein
MIVDTDLVQDLPEIGGIREETEITQDEIEIVKIQNDK